MKLTLSTTVNGVAVDLQITGDNATEATGLLARVSEALRMEEEALADAAAAPSKAAHTSGSTAS